MEKIVGRVESVTGIKGVTILADGEKRSIPFASLFDLETDRSDAHLAAEEAFQKGKDSGDRSDFSRALELFRSARSTENRYWVKQLLTARIVDSQVALGEAGHAADEFFLLVQTDPATPYLASLPLDWTGRLSLSGLATDQKRLLSWLEPTANPSGKVNPAGRLLAASLLLSGAERSRAITALRELVTLRSPDPNNNDLTEYCRCLSLLAMAQLWKTSLAAGPKPADVRRWAATLDHFPPSLAVGPAEVVARGFQKTGQPEAAEEILLKWKSKRLAPQGSPNQERP